MPYLFLYTSFILTLAGFLSRWGWGFDLASHFRLQYLAIQMLCVILCLFQRRKRLLIVVLFFALVNLSLIVPYYFPAANPSVNKITATPVKILLINLNSPNTNHTAVSNYIQKIAPDILALEEINARWIGELLPLLRSYPYFKEVSQENNFGLGLYSKIPLEDIQVKHFASDLIPSLVGNIILDGKRASLIFTHPMPPGTNEHYRWRNTQFEQIALLKPSLQKDILLVGDLNSTSWSYHFQKLKKDLGLKDSRQGFGLQTSWPSFLPYAGITIDHCLVSKNFEVLKREIGPSVGSDHLPVLIKIALQK